MGKPLLFIIEDDIEIRRIFTLTLQDEYEIESFYDGHAALARLQQVIPALIILDLKMPRLSGREVLQKIQADERSAKIPVILATSDAAQAAALQDEADLVLLKPISPIQLRLLASRVRSRSG